MLSDMRAKRYGWPCSMLLRQASIAWLFAASLLLSAQTDSHSGRSIHQYTHTSWTAREGAPPNIQCLAQGKDGFLWIGSQVGLFRFDGLSFERFQDPNGSPIWSGAIYSLLAAPNGDVWVASWAGDIAVIRNGHLHTFPPTIHDARAGIWNVGMDATGVVWAATTGGLWRLDGEAFQRIDDSWNFRGREANFLYTDPEGTMWVATNSQVWTLKRGSRRFELTAGTYRYGAQIGHDPAGRLWIADAADGVQTVRPAAGNTVPPTKISLSSGRFLFNTDGALWIATQNGLQRVENPDALRGTIRSGDPHIERYGIQDGLSGDMVRAILCDREGNIWVGTQYGLDQFRPSIAVPISLPRTPDGARIVAADDGNLWLTMNAELFKVDHRHATLVRNLGETILFAIRDRAGDNWWFGSSVSYRMSHGVLTKYPPLPGITDPYNGSIFAIADKSNIIWAWTGSGVLSFLKEGTWHSVALPDEFQKSFPANVLGDPDGDVWFSFASGDLYRLRAGVFSEVLAGAAAPFGRLRSLTEHAGKVWISGENGLGVIEESAVKPVRLQDPALFKSAKRTRFLGDGNFWMVDDLGVAHADARSVARALADPTYALSFQHLSLEDGIPGPLNNGTAQATDGCLWYVADGGLAWLDPDHIAGNPVPPLLVVKSVASGGRVFDESSISLPPQSSKLEVQFSALSLTIPEKVQVRYRLDGVDREWQDPGLRRTAFYNNLGPGRYRFRMIAANESGVWSKTETTLSMYIAPAWYQTLWFRTICALAVLASLMGLVRLRVWQIKRAISETFDERLAERTRVARQLHDTLLQTVQGSKMIADDALDPSADDARRVSALVKLSGWLERATHEGREALNSLRASTVESNHLAESLRLAAESFPGRKTMSVEVNTTGDSRAIHPIVRDEIFEIAFEALRNAMQHSHAKLIHVEIVYARDLTLTVKDDGVGMDSTVALSGRAGHFGLTGMRERASRIRGKLKIAGGLNKGTEVVLAVSGSLAYRTDRDLDL